MDKCWGVLTAKERRHELAITNCFAGRSKTRRAPITSYARCCPHVACGCSTVHVLHRRFCVSATEVMIVLIVVCGRALGRAPSVLPQTTDEIKTNMALPLRGQKPQKTLLFLAPLAHTTSGYASFIVSTGAQSKSVPATQRGQCCPVQGVHARQRRAPDRYAARCGRQP